MKEAEQAKKRLGLATSPASDMKMLLELLDQANAPRETAEANCGPTIRTICTGIAEVRWRRNAQSRSAGLGARKWKKLDQHTLNAAVTVLQESIPFQGIAILQKLS